MHGLRRAMPTHHRLRASAQHFSLKVVRSSTLHDVMDAGVLAWHDKCCLIARVGCCWPLLAAAAAAAHVVLLHTGCHLTLAHCTLLRMLATERVADSESLRAAACW